MDGHHRRLRLDERHHSGICLPALADGCLGRGADRDIYPGEQYFPDAEYAEVLDGDPPESRRGWRYPQTYGRHDESAGGVGVSAAEGVCLRPAHRMADLRVGYGLLCASGVQEVM